MNNYDYPMGADTSSAPWNQEENPPIEVEVDVTLTLNKTIKVNITDYEYDEEGNIDLSKCDLSETILNQSILPQYAHMYIKPRSTNEMSAVSALRNWELINIEAEIV